jgi:hypothetical protein
MEDTFGGGGASSKKSEAVADAINKLLNNLVIKCAKDEGVRDYFHVGVIGYGVTVESALRGNLQSKDLVPISSIALYPARVEDRMRKIPDGAGGIIDQKVKFPTWFDAQANGPTPMCQALRKAEAILKDWVNSHPNSYPPITINISDGEPTDGDPTQIADAIKSISTSDGNVLLLNLHLSSSTKPPVEFPDSTDSLPDSHATLLFNMSSILPDNMRMEAEREGFRVTSQSRGFIFNSDIVKVIQFLDIGTRASNLR